MVGGQQSRRTASPRSEHEHPKTKLLPKLEIHSDEAGPQDALVALGVKNMSAAFS